MKVTITEFDMEGNEGEVTLVEKATFEHDKDSHAYLRILVTDLAMQYVFDNTIIDHFYFATLGENYRIALVDFEAQTMEESKALAWKPELTTNGNCIEIKLTKNSVADVLKMMASKVGRNKINQPAGIIFVNIPGEVW